MYQYLIQTKQPPPQPASKLPTISRIRVVMYVSELFVDGKCIIDSLAGPGYKSWRQCVINKPTTVDLCISPVYRRLAVAKFSKSTM